MYKSEFKQKAWSLPVADLLYVGKSTNRKLALFGIKTIGDLARTDEDVLNSHLGKIGSILWSFANGYDDSPVKLENTHAPIKSVGNSTTTPKDLVCDEDVKIVLYILAESVAAIRMKITIMQTDIMKSQIIPKRMHMHLANAMRVISGFT